MALTASMYRVKVTLSDVERGSYESLDLRLARHPSETVRYLLSRLLAYCLNYQEGIAFSKGGLSTTDEPPVAIRDATGLWQAWIDVGSPSAERLHKAAKLAPRVAVYTYADVEQLRREMRSRPVHRASEIEVWCLQPSFLDRLEGELTQNTSLELVRSDGQLYVTINGNVIESALERASLVD